MPAKENINLAADQLKLWRSNRALKEMHHGEQTCVPSGIIDISPEDANFIKT